MDDDPPQPILKTIHSIVLCQYLGTAAKRLAERLSWEMVGATKVVKTPARGEKRSFNQATNIFATGTGKSEDHFDLLFDLYYSL